MWPAIEFQILRRLNPNIQTHHEARGPQHTHTHTHTPFLVAHPITPTKVDPVVQWLSYSPLDPRFAGSIPTVVAGFFKSVKIRSMTRDGSKAVGPVS